MLVVSLRRTDSERGKARRLDPTGSLSPADPPPSLRRQLGGNRFDAHRLSAWSRAFALRPHLVCSLQRDQIPQPSRRQPVAEFLRIAVASISEHTVPAYSPAKSIVELKESDFPLAQMDDLPGHASLFTSVLVLAPALRQVQPQPDATAA